MEDRIFAYKVVSDETRYGSNAMGFVKSYDTKWSYFKEELNRYPKLIPFFPKYTKGALIKAVPNSYGIFAFKTYTAAEDFIRKYRFKEAKIVLVAGKLINQSEIWLMLDDVTVLE